jgi:hypothetical protein
MSGLREGLPRGIDARDTLQGSPSRGPMRGVTSFLPSGKKATGETAVFCPHVRSRVNGRPQSVYR